MSRHSLRVCICLLIGLSLAAGASPVLAQPRLSFGAASSANLAATVSADDFNGGPAVFAADQAFGFQSPFWYSGGRADWGNAVNIGVYDGEIVRASSNPLVRLDGDGTQQVRIAWKAWTLLDSEFSDPAQRYQAIGTAATEATLALALTDLTAGTAYEVWYYWTFEADAQEEHEDPAGDDPAAASGGLEVDIASGGGPGPVFDEYVDNFSGGARYKYDAGFGGVQFVAAAHSESIVIDLDAQADSQLNNPPRDDLSSCRFRGTLVLRLVESVVIITEVVDGDLWPGNPRFIEITNCGPIDVAFDSSDYLAVYFDGSDLPGVMVSLAGYALASGDSLVIASSANGGDQAFSATYGFDADIYTTDVFGDGNDVYALQHGVWVLDTYGVIGVDPPPDPPPGERWVYQDSYAYSRPNRFPNSGNFDVDNWVVGPEEALAAPTDPECTALLQALTTPGTHHCEASPGYGSGDLNCDGLINAFDIDPFVLALTSGPTYVAYYAAFPHCDHMLADCNGDGAVNAFDIDPFVQCLTVGC
jgi:hypothetical protein